MYEDSGYAPSLPERKKIGESIEMKKASRFKQSYVVVFWLYTAALPLLYAAAKDPPPAPVIATVNGTAVRADALGDAEGDKLIRFRTEEYEQTKAALNEKIDLLLLSQEAVRRNITVKQLLHVEIDEKVAPVSREEGRGAYEINTLAFPGATEEAAIDKAIERLREYRRSWRRAAFLKELRQHGSIAILLDPPRLSRDLSIVGPGRGPEGAPVRIVEFSDFQCPFCAQSQTTLKRIMTDYGDRVRIVFRHFPLPMHADARLASEAAACAEKQGKFWPMHDQLFASQSNLARANLTVFADDAGLEEQSWSRCLDSGEGSAPVFRDMEEGAELGINATPTFFINGRLVVGRPTYEAFRQVIDEELARAPRQPAQSPKMTQ